MVCGGDCSVRRTEPQDLSLGIMAHSLCSTPQPTTLQCGECFNDVFPQDTEQFQDPETTDLDALFRKIVEGGRAGERDCASNMGTTARGWGTRAKKEHTGPCASTPTAPGTCARLP